MKSAELAAALLLALTAPALAVVLPASIAQPAVRVAPRCALAEKAKTKLTSQHCASIATFLNENFEAELLEWTLAKTEVGKTSRGKNMFSGGSWKPRRSVVEALDGEKLTLRVDVAVRGKPDEEVITELPFDARAASLEELQWKLIELSTALGQHTATASLLAMPDTFDDYSLPDDMWLNDTPNQHSVRQMIYGDVTEGLLAAIADEGCSRRMSVWCTPPELNMEMDSYRVGTLLELVRELGLALANQGKKVRICVQGSMGEGAFSGMPRVLSGVRKVMTMMDWGDGNKILGPRYTDPDPDNDAEGAVRFGAVGAAEVVDDDDVLLVLAPQSMVGASIHEPLSEMAEAAGDRPFVIVNALLQDKMSAAGVMSYRGRGDRIAFAESFKPVYHFRLLYSGTTFMYPILGALRMSHAGTFPSDEQPYIVYSRVTTADGAHERYLPVDVSQGEPSPETLTKVVPRVVRKMQVDKDGTMTFFGTAGDGR